MLGAASVVFVLLHNEAVSDIKGDCPNTSRCDPSQRNAVSDAHNLAVRDEALAIGLGAGAVVAAGVGAFLFFSHPSASPSTASSRPVAFEAGSPGAPLGGTLSGAF